MKNVLLPISFLLLSSHAIAQLKVVTGGAVGIGTTTPTASNKLDVYGDAILTSYGKLKFNDAEKYVGPTGGSSDLGLISTTTNAWLRVGSTGGLALWGQTGGASGSTPDAFLNTSGNLGIGTTGPSEKLQVQGNGLFATAGGTVVSAALVKGNYTYSTASTPDYTWYGDATTGLFHPSSGGIIGFSTGGTERIRISSTGNVGIGTTNPQRKLVVSSSGAEGIEIHPFTGYNQIISYKRSTSAYIPLVLQDASGGYVGIGLTNPAFQLELGINSAAKPSSSTWAVTSDEKTKSNVESYDHGLDLVRKVKLISYEYNGVAHTPKGEHGIGVIAQDFQKIFPNSVKPFTVKNDSLKTNETFLGVDFHELFIANVGAVRELDKLVLALDSTVKAQNAIIDELQNRVLNCCNSSNHLNSSNVVNSSTLNNTATSVSTILYQNIPNPFTEKTQINFSVGITFQNISISIFDMQGTLLKTHDHLSVNEGKGSITINGNELRAGMYMYSLIIDGKEIDTKRMILTK